MSRFLLSLAFLSAAVVRADDLPAGAFARAGGTTLRHPDRPTSLAFSVDGARLASGGTDGTLRVWDATTGAELHRVAVPDATLVAVAFSADGSLLAASFGDRKVRLYDARTYRPLRVLAAPDLETVALTHDGKLVGGSTVSAQVFVVESASGLERVELPPGRALAFAPDGGTVATSDEEDRVTVYQLPSGKPLRTLWHPNRDGITSVAFSGDGTKLAAADPGETGRVRVWDLRTGDRLAEWVGEAPVAFRSADQIVGRRGGKVVVWSLAAARPVRELDSGASVFAVSADGRRLATAGFGTRIRLWDLTTGCEVGPPGRDNAGNVTGLAAYGRSDVLVPTTRGLSRWVPSTNEGLAEVKHPADPGAVAVAGSRLVAASAGRIGVWDGFDPSLPTAGMPSRLIDGVTGLLRGAWVSSDGTRVALLTGERSLAVADPASGKLLRSWDAPAPVLAAALAPAGDRLTAALRDGTVRCWRLADGGSGAPAEAWSARVPRGLFASVAYPAADGRFVAVTSMVRVTLFDAATGSRIDGFVRRLDDGPFRAVALSPDGSLVAAGFQGSPGAITVWETATRSVVRRFTSGAGTTRHLLFRDGGRSLVSANGDDALTAWDLSGRVGRPKPTADELRAAWDLLDRDDPAVGHPPVWTLAAGGADGVATVRAGLARSGEIQARVKKLIADLDARSFRERERAGAELLALGSHALPALVDAAESHPSLEARRRAEDALTTLRRANVVIPVHGLFGEPLRQVRAVAALEAIGGPDAAKLLEEVRKAGGRPGEEAERALKRLDVR